MHHDTQSIGQMHTKAQAQFAFRTNHQAAILSVASKDINW